MESIRELGLDLIKDQTITVLKKARDCLIKLLVNGLSSTIIFIQLVKVLLGSSKLTDQAKMEIIHWASFYEHR